MSAFYLNSFLSLLQKQPTLIENTRPCGGDSKAEKKGFPSCLCQGKLL